jgi:hypothetical protein
MKKWEYKVVSAGLEPLRCMNETGQEGWEAFMVDKKFLSESEEIKLEFYVWLKREIE